MKEKVVKLPKTPAACADLLYQTRADRLRMQKQVDKLQALETTLKNYFVEKLPKSDATGIAGKLARVQVTVKRVPVVDDWERFYAHVKKTGNFELLQRRLNEGAVKERWEAKKDVPGIGAFNAPQVSCTALKG